MWVHEFGQPRGVDGVLVDGVELGQDSSQHCPDHVARKPWDPVSCQESLSQRGLTHPGCATEEVKDAASHGGILPTDPRDCWPSRVIDDATGRNAGVGREATCGRSGRPAAGT